MDAYHCTRRQTATIWGMLLAIACVTPTHAHHNSSGIFDFNRTITVEATLTRLDWTNPHVYLYAHASQRDGSVQRWEIQAGAVGSMSRMGWSKDKFRIGDTLKFTGNPGQRGRPEMLLQAVDAGDETRPTRMDPSVDQAANDEVVTSLEGTWWTLLDQRQSMLAFFPDAEHLTERGRKARDTFDDKTEFPGLDCVPFIAPFSMILADLKTVHIEADRVRIVSEYDNAERVIVLRGEDSQAVDANRTSPALHGQSIGVLSRRTLTVTTQGYAEHRVGNGWGLPSGRQRTLMERFELADDGKQLHYRYQLSDPDDLTAPIKGSWRWVPRNDLQLTAGGCSVASARRYLEKPPNQDP